MNTKLVIFDLDGTLLDTIEDLAAAGNHALEMCGYPLKRTEEYYALVGRGIDNLLKGAMPEEERNPINAGKMRQHFLAYYNEHNCDLTRPYEGILEMLEALQRKGIATAIASNKYQRGTERLAERYFSGHGFIRILGQREGVPIKPDPHIIHEAMESMPGTAADEVVYCGDSEVDMMTGANAGVRTIGVTWGFRSKEELLRHNPWMTAEKPEDIVMALG